LSCEHRLVRLEVKGLKGGHSGIDIDKQRANGIKVLALTLDRLLNPGEWSPSGSPAKSLDLGVLSLSGGNARNAIPREAVALLRLGEDLGSDSGSGSGSALGSRAGGLEASSSTLVQRVREIEGELRGLFKEADPDLRLAVKVFEGDEGHEWTGDRGAIIDPTWLRHWLLAILACPSQPYRFELSIPGLVRTSANLGVLETTASSLTVRMKLRGSHEGELALHAREVAGLLRGFGAQVARGGSYCGWQPDLESPLLATAQEVHRQLFGHKAAVKAIHAGLECGLIGDKYPGLRMISFGPQIVNAHSPDEAVAIPSVERFWRYLKALVMTLAGEPG
jgi:dipeptidase D